MSRSDLEQKQVTTFGPHSLVPGWKESAAEYGVDFVVRKVFGRAWESYTESYRRHPSGHRPGVKWFTGERARTTNGYATKMIPGTIWLSAKMESWREIVEAAAHETVHTYGYDAKELYHEHELPTLVGKLAAAHWAGERDVLVRWGELPEGWLPEGETEVSSKAVVLNFADGDSNTYVNAGTQSRPRWARRLLSL